MKRTRVGIIKYIILTAFIALAVVCAILFGKVGINYDITKYLDDDTQTKISLQIIENEFGMTGNMQVMIEDITEQDADEFASELAEIENVLSVTFDKTAETSYKDGKALFNILINGNDSSEEAKQVLADVKALCAEFESVHYGGSAYQGDELRKTIGAEMIYILGVSLALVAIILLITSKSWLEPIILLVASGFAVVINLGSNIVFGEISYITSSVAAILQLALSIDYSIVVLHSYRAEKQIALDTKDAMLKAVKKVIKPISASALTTIAGLFALLFMTFTIGFDIGVVLIKGIVVSAITAITLLPAIVLILEKPVNKLKKIEFVPSGKAFCWISKKAGKVILPIALVAVVLCGVCQSFSTYSFTASAKTDNTIQDTFGKNSTLVIVYRNGNNDVERERSFLNKISEYKSGGKQTVLGTTAYSNTVMQLYSPKDAVATLGVSENDAELLYTMYYFDKAPSSVKMTLLEFVEYTAQLLSSDEDVQNIVISEIDSFFPGSSGSAISVMERAPEAVAFFREFMDSSYSAKQIYELLSQFTNQVALSDVEFLYDVMNFDGQYVQGRKLIKVASKFTNIDQIKPYIPLLNDVIKVDQALNSNETFDYKGLAKKLSSFTASLESIGRIDLPEDMIYGIYLKYAQSRSVFELQPITAKELLNYVLRSMQSNTLLSSRLDAEMQEQISAASSMLTEAEKMFIGPAHNRMIITVDLPVESEQTSRFVEYLTGISAEVFGSDAYIAGEIASTYDLKTTFDGDNKLISIFTIVSVFVIVMLIFRSISLPVILVAVIQGAIWIALSIWLAIGEPLFFMSFIMGNCILMGATIDYGILMSSNYVSYRETLDKKEALLRSVNAAMPTVFSSGMIMTVCGFVIGGIATQNAIASVGTMIGIGTLASVFMITVVLPSALYVLDGLIMKLSIKKRT